MPSESELFGMLRKADAAGDDQAARRFVELIKQGRESQQAPQQSEPEQAPQRNSTDDFLSNLENPTEGFSNGLSEALQLEGDDKVSGLINQAGQGLTLNLADEGQAGLWAAIGTALPESMGGLPDGATLGDNYRGIRDTIRERNKQFSDDNPKAALTAQLAGGLATGGTGLSKTLATKAGAGVVGKALAGGVTGAVIGGTAGAGNSEAELSGDNKDVGQFLADTSSGAAIGAVGGSLIGATTGYLANKTLQNKELKRILESGNGDSRVAEYTLNGAGKAVKMKESQAAIKQGFDAAVVDMVKGSSRGDRVGMQRMAKILETGKRNAVYADSNRPADVVGNAILKRYDDVKGFNIDAGKRIGAASDDFIDVQVGQAEVISQFKKALQSKGVKFDGGKVNYKDSDLSLYGSSKTLVSRILQKAEKVTDGKGAHELKQAIDRAVTYGKTNQKIADPATLNLVKELRANLNTKLGGYSKQYDLANKDYKSTIEALENIDSLVGKKTRSARTMGVIARGVSSNNQTGDTVGNTFSILERVAKEQGAKYSDDVTVLRVFTNELERRFGSSARTSFQGNIENAVRKSAKDFAIDKTLDAVNSVKGVNDENAMIALRKLLATK